MAEQTLELESPQAAAAVYNNDPRLLQQAEERLNVRVTQRENWFSIEGEANDVNRAKAFLMELDNARNTGIQIRDREFIYVLGAVEKGESPNLHGLSAAKIEVSSKKPHINPKTQSQKVYIEAMRTNDITFGLGPAGTGKTYLAVAMAISNLKERRVSRIILTRPAVEAGEALGFLPGDLKEKILPYLRPLYDALRDMLEPGDIERWTERGILEVAPLAYMRGRTLTNSFMILDEAQNTTREQMFMFLTRLGEGSKCVVTGDLTQIDLPPAKKSGIVEAVRILEHVPGVAFHRFAENDALRHPMVQQIVKAYQDYRHNH